MVGVDAGAGRRRRVRSRTTRPLTHRGSDRGETLIEILISIVILGVGIGALMSGMGTAAVASGLHTRQAQQIETVRNFVDAVTSAPYVNCATGYVPAGYGPADVPGYTLKATVSHYATGHEFKPTCPAVDEGAQRIKVEIAQGDDRVRGETFVIVKRRPCNTSFTC